MNRIFLSGNTTKDMELRYTPSGVAVVQFDLAVRRSFAVQGQERQTDFITCVAWRKLAEIINERVGKGKKILVMGSYQVRKYQNNEQQTRYAHEILLDEVEFMFTPDRERHLGDSSSDPRDNTDPFKDDGKPIDISDDDLPF